MTPVPPIFSSSREEENFFVLLSSHQFQPGAVLAEPQLHDLRWIGESVTNDRAGLRDAKRNDGGIRAQLPCEIELLLRLLQPHLVENFFG